MRGGVHRAVRVDEQPVFCVLVAGGDQHLPAGLLGVGHYELQGVVPGGGFILLCQRVDPAVDVDGAAAVRMHDEYRHAAARFKGGGHVITGGIQP